MDKLPLLARLPELEPQFIKYEEHMGVWHRAVGDPLTWQERGTPSVEVHGLQQSMVFVNSLSESQGIIFLCPTCFIKNGRSNMGTHLVEVSFKDHDVLDGQGTRNKKGLPVRWNVSGTNYSDLTTDPSILLEGGCGWHGFIKNGEVT